MHEHGFLSAFILNLIYSVEWWDFSGMNYGLCCLTTSHTQPATRKYIFDVAQIEPMSCRYEKVQNFKNNKTIITIRCVSYAIAIRMIIFLTVIIIVCGICHGAF